MSTDMILWKNKNNFILISILSQALTSSFLSTLPIGKLYYLLPYWP